ncbi:chemotaxis protein MotB [Archangium gephyra]|uniref:Chemotaxis protein MotB n=1 Tax=Archangium gephyra TaxID=48 RepID=A0AAC8TI01_9BACT|nr:OmpA family protein [Archangium gephyra]AKJ06767.1 Flagellar motor rotation protein MotB [Archangium gephyra]REG31934.1 chemotaxis protein MotB [Archangium gephyra]
MPGDSDKTVFAKGMAPQNKGGGSKPWLPWLVTAVVALLAGVAGYFGYGAYAMQKERAEAAEKSAAEARAQTVSTEQARKALEAQLSQQLAAKDQKLTALEDERTRLSTEREQLQLAVQEKDAELARLKATYEDIEQKLKAEIADGEIRLSQGEGRIQVDLVDKILFDSGEASLSPRGSEVLARLGTVLSKVENRSILVSGHTDDAPPSQRLAATYPTNWELSVARAVNVVRFLGEKASVPPGKLVAAGHSDTKPVASNANAKGRARNRRIEILLIPDLPAGKQGETKTAADAR